jgi:hypothetical protein
MPPRAVARVVVGVCLAAMIWLVVVGAGRPLAQQEAATSPPAEGDLVTYERIIDRLRAGDGYYSAAHSELLAGNYGTRSVFNWRTPAYPMFLAFVSPGGARVVLSVLALAAVLLLYGRLKAGFGIPIAAASVAGLTANLAILASPKSIYFSEMAAGVLILLSIAAYSNRRFLGGVLAGLAALFVRELAAPYVVISVVVALRHRRWPEVVAWGAGLTAYAAYFGAHWSSVNNLLGPADRAGEGWLRFGGADFVLSTASYNGVLGAAPLWVAGVLLPLGLLGLANWPDGLRGAATVGCFLLLFVFVGNIFNAYWGLLYTPLMMLGLPLAFPAIAAAYGSDRRQDQQTEAQPRQSGP